MMYNSQIPIFKYILIYIFPTIGNCVLENYLDIENCKLKIYLYV
jgi:hypothetical protein